MELDHTIHVDFQVWRELTARRVTRAMTENDVIRKLLDLTPLPGPLASLRPGDHVHHPTYGPGVVEKRSGTDVTVRLAGEPRPRIFGIPEAEKAGMMKVAAEPSPSTSRFVRPIPRKTSDREKLKVIFPDGTEIFSSRVVDTFTGAIEKIGPERVSRLGISMSGEPLVETRPGKRPSHWKGLATGHYVNTNSSTGVKREQLERIRDELRDRFRVETV